MPTGTSRSRGASRVNGEYRKAPVGILLRLMINYGIV
jgi:hypothetical protein